MRGSVLILGAAAAAAVTPLAAAAPAKKPPAYVAYGCQHCHGLAGQGGSGPPLLPILARPIFEERVRRPVATMPPYPERLMSDAALDEIYAYVERLPPPPPLARVPLLQERMPKAQTR
jgi:mono/diheme cytochrome c family protein